MRLRGVVALMSALDVVPVPVAAALAHAELVHSRPFTRANGTVARAVERYIVRAGGLDPTGVAVTEAGHGKLAARHTWGRSAVTPAATGTG